MSVTDQSLYVYPFSDDEQRDFYDQVGHLIDFCRKQKRKIGNTLGKEIKHYDRSTIEAHNEYNHIPAALTMKHFLVLKEKLEAVRVNCRIDPSKMPFISRKDWLHVAALCYTFSIVWGDKSQKPIAILQRWWWLVHQDSQRWMMRLSQWQIASDQIKADILAECQIRQIDANSFLVSSDPDLDGELGIEEDTSDSDWD